MSGRQEPTQRSDPSFKPLMRNLALEVVIYAPLVAAYFFLVLKFASHPIVQLYHERPILYAAVAILVIVLQGVLLEALTSWLLRRIGLR